MKSTLLSIFFALTCLGCSDQNPEPDNVLSDSIVVEPQSVNVSSAPQEVVLKVQADADWGVSAVDPWLKLSQTGGGKGETEIKVSIEENNAEEQREAVLLFRTTSQKVEVPVTQHYKVVAVEIKDQTLLKALLKLLDKDGDGILSTKEISGVTELNLSDCGLADAAELVGLFPDLVSLDLSGNKLESLDIRLMPKLENLNASNNPSLSIIYVWSDFVAPEGFKVPEGVEYVEPEIYTPAGYQLVWRDEFNDPSLIMPDTKEWWYETAEPGWVNNELQTYVAGRTGDIITADVSDGTLKIRAIKSGNRVYSARVNTKKNWTYGYFEARLKLPKGKGTWPAFWMMPSVWSGWPEGGEIDIMEHVGCVPTEVSSSIHCKSYYHAIGTQKTAAKKIATVMDEFHVYALEWTPEYIKTYVDGELLFHYNPDNYPQGRNADTWPFNKPFELKLNLAWGGDWGGMYGVDESCLPATYEIDYVRVFQQQ
jgi:hypothetical protein